MAEFVNQRVEDMISELEQMRRIELYSAEEIKEISKKRTDFEYKIHRQTRCKEDYLRYIAYECILLQDIRLRREKLNIKDKKTDIEYAISKRVNNLYKDTIFRFASDLEIWINYFKFCKSVNFVQYVTSMLTQMLQVHGDKPKVWQLACRWEYEEMNSVDTARKFILKGLHRHPKSQELYLDAFRIELLAAVKLDDENKVTQIERAKIIMENGMKHIDDVNFHIQLCKIVNDFDFATCLHSQLYSLLWEEHSDKKEAWDFIALCELEERNVELFGWKSLKGEFFLSKCPKNLANYFNVYETASIKIDNHDVCNSYINSAIKLSTDKAYDIATKLQILKRALMKGHMLAQLNEQHYKIWVDLLCQDDESSREEILTVLEEACINLPSSEYLWEERLKRSTSNGKELLRIFKVAKSALPADKVSSVWSIIIENTRDIEMLKKLNDQSILLPHNVSCILKPKFLEMFYNLGGIEIVRKEYISMVKAPPVALELHRAMIDIEKSQKIASYKDMRNCYELATQQFGKKDVQIWLDYINFEMTGGNRPELCGLLYKRACACLDNSVTDSFISQYSLTKHLYVT